MTYGSSLSVTINLIRNNETYMRIKLIRKLLTDQLDLDELPYTKTHSTLHTSYVADDHRNTFTFTEPNSSLNQTDRKETNKLWGSTVHWREKWRRECANGSIVSFKNVGCWVEALFMEALFVEKKERSSSRGRGSLVIFKSCWVHLATPLWQVKKKRIEP